MRFRFKLFAYYKTCCPCLKNFYSVSSDNQANTYHKILVIGGGTGGCVIANRLARKLGAGNVCVIEPSPIHYYQALWTLVGAGISKFEDSYKPTKSLLAPSVKLVQDNVTELQPDSSRVLLSNGQWVSYDYLILALGMCSRFDQIKGAEDALKNDDRVCSNFSPQYVQKTHHAFKKFGRGEAIFTHPEGPIKCAGAPQKVLYLFDDYLRNKRNHDSSRISFYTALPNLLCVEKYANSLAYICQDRNIDCHFSHSLIEVNSISSEAVFKNLEDKSLKKVHYDFLHITPPMSVPDVLKNTSRLTNPSGCDYVDVDIKSLRHSNFSNIFALGDCAALPTSRTAAGVSAQADVLERNLLDVMKGGNGKIAEYDGYTACLIVTGFRRGILTEFDYEAKPLEVLPIDQSKERYLFYFFKRFIMPFMYWTFLLPGYWSGPSKIRKLLHLGQSR